MPRLPVRPAAASAEDAIVRPEQSPKPAKVKSLLSLCRTAQENMNEIKESLGGTMSDAVQNHHLHKRAFSKIRSLDKLSPEKLAEEMSHFFYYYEASGLQARAASAPTLPAMAGPGEEAVVDPPAPRPRAPARAAAPPTAPEPAPPRGFPVPAGNA